MRRLKAVPAYKERYNEDPTPFLETPLMTEVNSDFSESDKGQHKELTERLYHAAALSKADRIARDVSSSRADWNRSSS